MKVLWPFRGASIVLTFCSIFYFTPLAEAATTLLVKYKNAPSGSLRSQFSSHVSGSLKQFIHDPQSALVELDADANPQEVMEELRQDPAVEYVEEDAKIFAHSRPNDSRFPEQWALESSNANIGAEQAWDVITSSSSILIAIIDSGCNYNHEDLEENVWRNPGEVPHNGIDDDRDGYVDDYNGYDFQNNDSDPMDDFEHGSLVFGIIGAAGNNKMGISGINWSAKVMCLKVLDSAGNSTISKAVEAIQFAIAHKVKIINMSWGYVPSGSPSRALEDAMIRAQQNGILVVASAGNGSQGRGQNNDADVNNANYPSSYPQSNIISVSATDPSDQLTSFSNYGKKTVDIAAPGVSILSTHPLREYSLFTGTSAAAPHVSGAAALIWALNPNLGYAEIKRLILETGDGNADLSGKTLSGGRLNINNAIHASPAGGGSLLESAPRFPSEDTNSMSTSEVDANIAGQGGCSLSAKAHQTKPSYLFILVLGTVISLLPRFRLH